MRHFRTGAAAARLVHRHLIAVYVVFQVSPTQSTRLMGYRKGAVAHQPSVSLLVQDAVFLYTAHNNCLSSSCLDSNMHFTCDKSLFRA